MTFRTLLAGAALAAVAAAGPAAKAQEVALRVVTSFPTPLVSNQPLRDFVEKVNVQGKGKVRINIAGGPEVITAPDQAQAVRKGVIDMLYGAANYYQGVVPEGDAVIAASKKPWEVRANGGWKLLQDVHAQKMNTHLLGWPGAGFQFFLYLRDEPKYRPDGVLDLTGLKIRTTPIYREFLAALGATPVVIQIPEVYTSLERGLVNGVGFPIATLLSLGWNKHLKYRMEPGFFTGDILVNVNLDKWKSLPQETRDLLDKIAAEHDRASWDWYAELDKKEDADLRKAGMKVVAMSPEGGKKFVAAANKVVWDRLAKNAPDNAAQLKEKFGD
ncbi:MAG: TRAP transporter substrate-binding protein DctP [Rhodospirillaceae bacterium]